MYRKTSLSCILLAVLGTVSCAASAAPTYTITSAGSHKWIRLVALSDSGSVDKVHVVVSNSNSDILAYRWSGGGAPGNEWTR